MALPTLLELAEAGAHYGHHRSLTYPKAKNFIYMVKNNVSLINLEETVRCLDEAQRLIWEYRQQNRPVLFVGTKRSIRQSVKTAAESIKAPYINERWYGGFLTNFDNFMAQIRRMKELETFLQSEKYLGLEKKERARHQARFDHYQRFLGGVSDLKQLPELLVVASATEDKIAIGEAQKLGIPVVAITDTDINPTNIDYPIPANDDAPRAVEMILMSLVDEPSSKTEAKKAIPSEEITEEVVVEKPKKVTKEKKATATAKKATTTKKTPVKKSVTKTKK